MDTVIRIENISKQYRLGRIGTGSLKHDVNRWWHQVRGKEDPYLRIGEKSVDGNGTFRWALRDVSFEVKQGEVLGIIGRNGAGKSTLLKILSRTTSPTTGTIKVKGRIASLLEVGTGFHPDLTGRENIFLNGAILGMSRQEIRKKFDEIVDFSGVEEYIDTPVKRYSSGMYVRLAFAVAAHLDPEILVVDEVLAVGDLEFQKKCLGKMQDVSSGGRTVIFVSHNMGTMLQLCSSGVCLKDGMVFASGKMSDVVEQYIGGVESSFHNFEKGITVGENQFTRIAMSDPSGVERTEHRFDENINVRTELSLPSFAPGMELAMKLIDRYKRGVFTIHEKLAPYYTGSPEMKLKVSIPAKFLTPGRYSWTVCINHPGVAMYDVNEDVAAFSVLDTGSIFARYEGADYGCVFVDYKIEKAD